MFETPARKIKSYQTKSVVGDIRRNKMWFYGTRIFYVVGSLEKTKINQHQKQHEFLLLPIITTKQYKAKESNRHHIEHETRFSPPLLSCVKDGDFPWSAKTILIPCPYSSLNLPRNILSLPLCLVWLGKVLSYPWNLLDPYRDWSLPCPHSHPHDYIAKY